MREQLRKIRGAGMGRVVRWNLKTLVNYTRYRTGKENLLRWKKILDPGLEGVMCRNVGMRKRQALK